MRQFEVAQVATRHADSHLYEHEVFVLEGEGVVLEGKASTDCCRRRVCRSRRDSPLRNTGAPLKFLCLIPTSAMSPAMQAQMKVADACTIPSPSGR